MPIYEYKCEQTGNVYEVSQSINAEALSKCALLGCECGGNSHTHRIISKNIGLIFNGKGFYETDYANKNKSDAEPPKTAACCSCSDSSCPHSQ